MIQLSMAVESSHREMIYERDAITFNDPIQTAYGNKTEEILPMYDSTITDLFSANVFKDESGVTLTTNLPFSSKRSRDSFSFNPLFEVPKAPSFNLGAIEFLSEDISLQMYQQQLEIDRFIAHHTEKVRIQIEEIRRRNTMRMKATYEQITNRLKTKEVEIMQIEQLNRSLQEKVKSMTVENQIWRELAKTNEATANTLQTNLQQVLAEIQLQQKKQQCLGFGDNGDDAESHSGSNFDDDLNGGERKVNDENEYCKSRTSHTRSSRLCRKCWKEESCVLLLPCRHLCVCNLCVSSINVCPICKSIKCASVHVNMS